MLFFFNADGNVINYVPEEIYQNSNKANTIYVVAPLSSANQVLAYITLPNGKVLYPAYATNENNLTLLSTLQINGEEFSVWSLTLNKIVTSISGRVIIQFAFINETQTITTQATAFFVSMGSSPYEPIDLTSETTIEDILQNISIFITNSNNDFEDFKDEVRADFNTLEEDLRTEIEGGISDYNNLSNKPIINADLTAILSPQTEYYRHLGETTAEFFYGAIYYYNGTTFSQVSTNSYVDGKIATVNQRIDALQSVSFVKVDTLPTASAQTLGKIYLVPVDNAETPNIYNEYITIEENGVYSWEIIGNTAINLSGKTAVTVGGVIQETWDADTKVDKSTLTDYVKNTDYADRNKAGVVTLDRSGLYGVGWNETAGLFLASASDTDIDRKLNANKAISPRNLDYAIKVGLTTNTQTLTAEERESALRWLGASLYMHTVIISSLTAMTNIDLQILSRQPNKYTSLADMVADTTLILPIVNYFNYAGDPGVALIDNISGRGITETSITWVEPRSQTNATINTTDEGYSFDDIPKLYELPTT